MNRTSPLLRPITISGTLLNNRVFMAPMTRMRANGTECPTLLTARYYAQRATAGLIVTEATQVCAQGKGYFGTPGIYTNAQEGAWSRVVKAVHEAGGRIAMQLWHVGRISHSLNQPDGAQPVAPSAVATRRSKVSVFKNGRLQEVPCEPARELSGDEISVIVSQYAAAAERAKRAGFDFVEIHAANGYLINQFLSTNTNLRTDQYGGSLENRARFLEEIVDAVSLVIGAGRVGVRISPNGVFNDIADSEAEQMACLLAHSLNAKGIAYLHVAEPDWAGGVALTAAFRQGLRERFRNCLVFCGNFDQKSGEELLAQKVADAMAFGRLYIANPDLVTRFASGAKLNVADPSTFYFGNTKGYTDYPSLGSAEATTATA
ncbi:MULTISPECIES: alkene reductase [unclassified Variovorax]|uniref:alkene reductase n=1 Tax=unclassified Variovorax TaxID=663243 RepID=UPI000D13B00F|nr:MULTISPECIES: alkene reductase [unclassified Variovorax]AVQ79767.1 alkene reductase [Variovorax sp. PMC12]QRY30897.1 alkene reductase [Variovorax sp. PDNC026]